MRKAFFAAAAAVFSMVPTAVQAQQPSPDFTYVPDSGPVGTQITVDGYCPFPQGDEENSAGDAIALYRASDDALVDVDVQLGNTSTGTHSETWTTTLTVEPTLETESGSEPTTPGAYELRLFCEIGSSFRGPGGIGGSGDVTQRSDADVIKPFTVTAATTTTTTTATTTTTTSTTTSTTGSTTSTTAPTTTTTAPAGLGATQSAATLSDSRIPPGGQVRVAGDGFAPDVPLDETLFSHPLSLGSTRSDAAGRYEITVTIPLAATPGPHQIVVSGRNPHGGEHRSVGALTIEDLDCSDFRFQDDAQAVLDAHEGDPHRLDGDNDGTACEALPRRAPTAAASRTSGTLPRTGTFVAGYLTAAVLSLGLGLGLVGLTRHRGRRT